MQIPLLNSNHHSAKQLALKGDELAFEMPFKDNHELPCEEQGWSPERCAALARECLATLAEMV